jgi:LytS/YehU family sensor histidine kinase
VSLSSIAELVRNGEEVEVIDRTSGENITATILTQIILDEGKKGNSHISSSTLHELIRWGNDLVDNSVDQVRDGVDRLVHNSVRKLIPLTSNNEVNQLRTRVQELETVLDKLLKKLEN